MPELPAQAGHSPQVGAAPGQLETVREFVNTLDIDLGADQLSTPEALAGWLAEHDLLPPPRPGRGTGRIAGSAGTAPAASAADVRHAVELREALRGVLASHLVSAADQERAGSRGRGEGAVPEPAVPEPAIADPVAELRRIAGSLRARLDVSDDGQVVAAPDGLGPAAGLTRILLIAAEASATGTWSRLKVCGADDCRWAFYDRSPTRSACWCSMRICGARAKSRAYRRRAARRPS
jgi:hypothetical protein